jgi:hypothetical protein
LAASGKIFKKEMLSTEIILVEKKLPSFADPVFLFSETRSSVTFLPAGYGLAALCNVNQGQARYLQQGIKCVGI